MVAEALASADDVVAPPPPPRVAKPPAPAAQGALTRPLERRSGSGRDYVLRGRDITFVHGQPNQLLLQAQDAAAPARGPGPGLAKLAPGIVAPPSLLRTYQGPPPENEGWARGKRLSLGASAVVALLMVVGIWRHESEPQAAKALRRQPHNQSAPGAISVHSSGPRFRARPRRDAAVQKKP